MDTVDTKTIPNGYSLTNIGIFPADWTINELKNVIKVYRGGSPRPIQAYLTTSRNGISWIKIGDVKIGAKYIESVEEKIIPEGASMSRRVHPGDFLLSNSMSFGRPYILKVDGCIHDGWLVLQDYQQSYNTEFLYYVLGSKIIVDQYLSKAAGSSVLNLNKELVSTVELPTPKLPEQAQIAQVLSDLDFLIEKTEKLIEKEKTIKLATMQELLSGKRRLSGFIKEWERIELRKIINVLTDYTANGSFAALKENVKYYSQKKYAALVRTTDLDKKTFSPERFTDKRGYDFLSKTALYGGEIIIANVGSIGKIFRVPSSTMPMTLAPNTYLLKFNNGIDQDYVYQWMKTNEFYTKLMGKIGSTTLQAINKENLRDIELTIPTEKTEQTAIAKVLFDMDSEIEALEKKLVKYNQIKQGAMQVLLTGKIRLNTNPYAKPITQSRAN